MTEQAQQQIKILNTQIATENAEAVRRYKLDHDNWARNKDLRAAAKQPAEDEPVAPMLKSLNAALAGQIFETWDATVIERSKKFNPITVSPDGKETPTPALEELQADYSPAITLTQYVPAPVKPTPGTASPIGDPITGKPGRRILVATFAGKIALGTEAQGPDGTYKLVDSDSPFNRTGEWLKV